MAVFFVAVVAWKRGRISWICLVPVFGAAFAMELLDLRDDYRSLGYFRLSASVHDVINTVLWPSIVVFLARVGLLK